MMATHIKQGDRFGALIALRERQPLDAPRSYWHCWCDCGALVRIHRAALAKRRARVCLCGGDSVKIISTTAQLVEGFEIPIFNGRRVPAEGIA